MSPSGISIGSWAPASRRVPIRSASRPAAVHGTSLVLRWKGGALGELTTPSSVSHLRSAPMRTPSAGPPPDRPLPRRQDRLDPQLARPQARLAWTRDPAGASALAADRRRRAHSAAVCRIAMPAHRTSEYLPGRWSTSRVRPVTAGLVRCAGPVPSGIPSAASPRAFRRRTRPGCPPPVWLTSTWASAECAPGAP